MPEVPGSRRWAVDGHASASSLHPSERDGPSYYYQPEDEQQDFCPGCYPEMDGGRWVHDRGCVFARRRTA